MDFLDEDITTEPTSVEYANFGHRLLASILDGLIFGILQTGLILGGLYLGNLPMILIGTLIALYKPIMEGTIGGTPGKKIMNLEVVDHDYERIGLAQSFLKNGIYVISMILSLMTAFWVSGQDVFLSDGDNAGLLRMSVQQESPFQIVATIWSVIILISCLFMLGNENKQTGHDMLAKTYVIRK